MHYTPVYIICSPRPQVGKTMLARLLSEFLLLKNGTVISFDINLKEPSLLEYLPRVTETADVIDTFGKMQLMDRLIVNDSVAKVIDLGYHAFDEFFKMIDEIGFMKEAVRRGVAPVILFMADTDRLSVRGYDTLRAADPGQRARDHRQRIRGARRTAARDGQGPHHGDLGAAAVSEVVYRPADIFLHHYLRQEKDSSTELHQWIRRNYLSLRDLEMKVNLQR